MFEKITNKNKVAELELDLQTLREEKAKVEGKTELLQQLLTEEQQKADSLKNQTAEIVQKYESKIDELTDKLEQLTGVLEAIEAEQGTKKEKHKDDKQS